MSAAAPELVIEDLGRMDYRRCHALMLQRVEARSRDRVPDTLLLVEHEPVFTAGRRDARADRLDGDLEIVPVERGGRLTYHGPGQIVAYPIVRLAGRGRDLHAWLHLHEDVVIDTLATYGLTGERDPRGTGVFVAGRKIASIGVAVRRWVSYHGLALNVSTDLDAFARIRPCGFDASVMTSLARELGTAPPLAEVAARLVTAFRARLAAYPH